MLDFADGRVRLVGVRAVRGGALVGQEIRSCAEHIPNLDARVAAIYRDGRQHQARGRHRRSRSDDEVFFLAAREDIRVVMSEMRGSRIRACGAS